MKHSKWYVKNGVKRNRSIPMSPTAFAPILNILVIPPNNTIEKIEFNKNHLGISDCLYTREAILMNKVFLTFFLKILLRKYPIAGVRMYAYVTKNSTALPLTGLPLSWKIKAVKHTAKIITIIQSKIFTLLAVQKEVAATLLDSLLFAQRESKYLWASNLLVSISSFFDRCIDLTNFYLSQYSFANIYYTSKKTRMK
jgi:hypothetical protein